MAQCDVVNPMLLPRLEEGHRLGNRTAARDPEGQHHANKDNCATHLGCEHATTSREVRQGSTLRHVPSEFDDERKERTSDTHVHREGDLHMG